MSMFTAPKGVPEYFPPRSRAFVDVRAHLARPAELAGYSYIELPVFEDTALYVRGVGESTDVVSKEMYTFDDRNGDSMTRAQNAQTLLIVDDERSLRFSIGEWARDEGYSPLEAAAGREALEAIREQAGRFIHAQVNCYRHDLLEPLAARLDEVTPDRIHILVEGRIVASGGMELAEQLERDGYDAFKDAAAARTGA